MNRIDPGLFAEAFTSGVRETWPAHPDLVAIDGKTSRRSHHRSAGRAPLHLLSAFATKSRLVLGQQAVADKTNEITAIPVLLERLAAKNGLKGSLVSIDAIGTNPAVATAIREAGADYLLAVKANQPSLRAEIERFFADPSVWPASTARSTSTRAMVALSNEPSRWHARSNGSTAIAGSPARSACLLSLPSSGLPHGSNFLTAADSKPGARRLIREAHRHSRSRGDPQSLGNREQLALGSRCHVRR